MKRIAYLAPELPSLSTTFVFNEILALKKLGTEIHTYSVHQPNNKAHGRQAEQMTSKTMVIYEQSLAIAIKVLIVNLLTHKRSSFKALVQLTGDMFKTGLVSGKSFKLMYQFIRGAWLASDLRKKNIEHLHIHFAHVPTQIGMYAAALVSIPFSFTAHANDIFEHPLLIKEKIKRAKRTVSISDYNIKFMKKKGGDLDKMEIVRCGVDSSLPVRDPIEANNRVYKIGTLGRLVEKKGVDTLIDAGKILKRNKFDFVIEIAGGGPLKNDLEKQVVVNGLQNIVHFLDVLPHSQVFHWMQTLDAFVLAAKKDKNGDMDGIPVVLMEAMNLGVPVLSTKISGIPELVQHQKSGLTAQSDNAAELAKNLIQLRQNQSLLDKLIQGAKQRIKDEFDQSLNARRLITIFNQ